MAESVVSLTYGTALYEAAKDLGKEEEILIEIKQLALLVQAYEDFSEFLNSPAIMPKQAISWIIVMQLKKSCSLLSRRRCSISSMC